MNCYLDERIPRCFHRGDIRGVSDRRENTEIKDRVARNRAGGVPNITYITVHYDAMELLERCVD